MSYVRAGTQEGLILALRSEVERLKGKINSVVASAEMTLGQVHVENEAVRQSFARKEDAYLRELKERTAGEKHYRDLYDVARAELDDVQGKARDNAAMLEVFRESMLGSSAAPPSGASEESKEGPGAAAATGTHGLFLAHPGQLVLRSTNSWALEVSKLRRAADAQAAHALALQERGLGLERELADCRTLLQAARAEAQASASMLSEVTLAQSVLGKPRSRDQQLLSTIRAALSSSSAAAGRMVKKDLAASVDNDEARDREVQRQTSLYQASLADLQSRWEEASGEGLPRVLEGLTERLAEARCLLQERAAELEAQRAAAEQHNYDKSVALERLQLEHAAAARWAQDKDALLAEQVRQTVLILACRYKAKFTGIINHNQNHN